MTLYLVKVRRTSIDSYVVNTTGEKQAAILASSWKPEGSGVAKLGGEMPAPEVTVKLLVVTEDTYEC